MNHLTMLLLLAAACGGNQKNSPESPSDDAEEPTEEPTPEPAPVDADPDPEMTPQKLYDQCLDRVEQPQEDGECETDADCRSAGCSGEVCTSVASAADIMTSCEAKVCFSVLETCGCSEGTCTWSIKEEIPAGQKLPKPPGAGGPGNTLPPTVPAPAPAPAPEDDPPEDPQ